MPRIARQQAQSGIYHIMLRGINRQDIFTEDADRHKFLQLLVDLQQNYDDKGRSIGSNFTLYAYCLMSNHVHLLYRQGSEGVEQSMKRLEVSYAQYFNKKYGRVGHFFQDRFKSEPCEDFDYFLTLLRYIHQNPVKAGITGSVENYPWSSWSEYICTSEHPTICNVSAPIRRIQQSGLGLKDLIDMVNDPLPDDIACLEVDNGNIRRSLSDKDVLMLLLDISRCETIAEFQRLPIEIIVSHILDASHRGAAMKSLARITGISYRQISKVVKNKK